MRGPLGRVLDLSCHAVSGSSGSPGQERSVLVDSPCGVTVTIRYAPLVTAAYGTCVARAGEDHHDPHVTATAPSYREGDARPR
jgi:hypothetical protein